MEPERQSALHTRTSRRHLGHIASRALAAVVLLLASGAGFSYFVIARIVVFGVAGYEFLTLVSRRRFGWAWLFLLVALLFNPFFRVRMPIAEWQVLDLVTAILCASMLPWRERTWPTLKRWWVRERLAVALSVVFAMFTVLWLAVSRAQSNCEALAAADAAAQKVGLAIQPTDTPLAIYAASLAHPAEMATLQAARARPLTTVGFLSQAGVRGVSVLIALCSIPIYLVVAVLRWQIRRRATVRDGQAGESGATPASG